MFQKMSASLHVVAFVFFFNVSQAELTAQRPPSPQALRNEMRLRAVTQPEEVSPNRAPVGPAPQLIATITTRIDRDRLEVRVYQNGQPVKLFPRFHELIVATPADHRMGLDNVVGRSVALVPSEKGAGRSDIFLGVGGVDEFCLAGNIFIVKQVLLSSRKNPIEVLVDGKTQRLKPGQALLLM